MANRKIVFLYKTIYNTIGVINYDATNNELNSFLKLFNIWSPSIHFKTCKDNVHQKATFECNMSLYNFFKSDDFKTIIKRLGCEVVLDSNHIMEID